MVVSRDYLGKGKDETALQQAAKSWGVDPKAEMYKLPAMYVGAYAERDAQLTLELWQEFKKRNSTPRYRRHIFFGN